MASYFAAAHARDVDGMIAGFAEDAVVEDEGRQHRGRVAIRGWMKETIEKYDFTAIQYRFTVEARKIARLEIG
ncbi:MAG TPA: nuclear transport factor 2 family protein [Polyangia bacterium]|nr:nuclear transport factor 2 family protein [Polyangia bacterium]